MRIISTSTPIGAFTCSLMLVSLVSFCRERSALQHQQTKANIDPQDSSFAKHLKPSKKPCGFYKCFFYSDDDPKIGYLVAPPQISKETLTKGWELAQSAQEKHSIQHFMLEPPINVNLSKDLVTVLNMNSKSASNKSHTNFEEGTSVHVVKSQVAPEPNVIIGFSEGKQTRIENEIKSLGACATDMRTFVENFSVGIAKAKTLVMDEPCLTRDFQVMVDCTGQVYHLDFDRCFRIATAKKRSSTLGMHEFITSLADLESRVYELLFDIPWK